MKKMLLFASVAAMLAACSDDDQPLVDTPVAEQGRTVTVTATLPTATRLALAEENNTIKVDWKESGETFAVVPVEAAAPATFTQTSGDQFTGTLTGSGPYYAFYPEGQLDEGENCSATSVGYSLKSQSGELDEAFTLMYARSEDGQTFSFRHLTAIVKFTLSGLEAGSEVSDVHIASTTSLPFSGTVDLTTGTLTADSEENVLYMGLADCTVATGGTCSFYAYLPPISKDNVLTMTLTTASGDNYVTTVEFAKDIEAGKYYRAARTVTKQETTSQHTAVDLGLSVKWASYNVGATAPEEYGDYYAWGGTETKEQYIEYDYTGTEPLGGENDVATVKWGGSWRMPTKAEWEELISNCTWTWTTLNGANGYQVSATNGNSIFLPAAGYCSDSSQNVGVEGNYWSTTPFETQKYIAYRCWFMDGSCYILEEASSNGMSIRPVCE